MTTIDRRLRCMGCDVRLVVGDPITTGLPAEDLAEDAIAYLRDFDARLSRFREDSELSALNADPRAEVPASPLLRSAVSAALWAAGHSQGLVDPTLLPALERAGYAGDFDPGRRASMADVLAAPVARRPARAAPRSAWRQIRVDAPRGVIVRPPGLRLDLGGTGKGMAADRVAARLSGRRRFAVDCGGDLHVGGPDAAREPFPVEVQHPHTGEVAQLLFIAAGGVATSGIDTRAWHAADGTVRHHLLDPATGEPAWTGLVSVTALGASALEAEVMAKAALLGGPDHARVRLGPRGGVLVHEDGDVELVGTLRRPVRATFSIGGAR